MNKFILDFNKLKELEITPEEYYCLLYIYDSSINRFIYIDDAESLQKKGFIKIIYKEQDETFILREKGKQLVKSFIYQEPMQSHIVKETFSYLDSIKDKDTFEEFIKQYRDIWKGLKIGSQGNAKSCSDKMLKWMKDNPNYSQDDILKAAKSYISTVDDLRFLQRADYFIYKKDKFGESSRLSDFIEEDDVKDAGWSSQLR